MPLLSPVVREHHPRPCSVLVSSVALIVALDCNVQVRMIRLLNSGISGVSLNTYSYVDSILTFRIQIPEQTTHSVIGRSP